MDLNRISLIGNMTSDAELKATTSGKEVTQFSVATNEQYTDAKGQKVSEAEFHNCTAWGKLAEIVSGYAGKGSRVFVEGRLKTEEYTSKQGELVKTKKVIVSQFILLDKKGVTNKPVEESFSIDQVPF